MVLRDPQETKPDFNIVQHIIRMIDVGFEKLISKELAEDISSTGTSIRRYFENKHCLLVYPIAWHRNWLEYSIGYMTQNIEEQIDEEHYHV